MPKFFVKNKQINADLITILGQDVNHIKNVLRLKKDDVIMICDSDTGCNYKCKIIESTIENILCSIIEKIENHMEDKVQISIFQGLPKSDKMEFIIQKCTELGVKEIFPVQMERCVVKLDSKTENKKNERWQKIAEAASKQCRRNTVCSINHLIDIKNICKMIDNFDMLLVPYENEENNSFKENLLKIKNKKNDKTPKVGIVIGPEGGFSPEEIDILKQNGASIITLGKRILRTETVAIAMTSVIAYEFNDFG